MDIRSLVPIVMFLSIPLTLICVPLARALARRIDREQLAPRQDGEAGARLERMEHAIESIAIEVERIAEGQRFTTRLLADRGETMTAPGRST